jgi:nitrate reductase NapAB chaperone NapD
MTISGVVLACRPQHLVETTESVNGLPWAEVHYADPKGRLVVIIEADDVDQSMDRLQELQRLPHVLVAELAEFTTEGDVERRESQGGDPANGDPS